MLRIKTDIALLLGVPYQISNEYVRIIKEQYL